MSVVLRSASGSLNDITFKNRLSVDRSSIISLASSKAGPAKKSEMILKAPTQDTTTNIVVAKPDGQLCSKRKPLKDITLKVCLQLSQSVASCQSSPDVPDADFTIYVDAPTTKTDKSTRDPIADGNEVAAVTLKTDKATTETDTQGKENVPPSSSCLILQPKDNKQNNTIPIEKPNKSSTKTTKKQPYKKQQQLQQTPVLDATMLKRKRRQNLDGSAGTTTKRASLRMMR